MAAEPGYIPQTAAAEPQPVRAIPDLLIQTCLGEVDGKYEEALDQVLKQFGFHPKRSELSIDELGDQSDVVQYHADDIKFAGNPADAVKHFQAMLKHMHAHQRQLGLNLDASLLQRWVREFQDTQSEQHRLPNGLVLPGTVHVTGATEPGLSPTTTLSVLSFRFLLPGHTSMYTPALIRANNWIRNTLEKHGVKYTKLTDSYGDTYDVDDREDGDATTDVTTFEIHGVQAANHNLLAFAKAVEGYTDFQGEENSLVHAVRRIVSAPGSSTVHAADERTAAEIRKAAKPAFAAYEQFIQWLRQGQEHNGFHERSFRLGNAHIRLSLSKATDMYKGSLPEMVVKIDIDGKHKCQAQATAEGDLAVGLGRGREVVRIPAGSTVAAVAKLIAGTCLKQVQNHQATASAEILPSLVLTTGIRTGSTVQDLDAIRDELLRAVDDALSAVEFTSTETKLITSGEHFAVMVKGLQPPFPTTDEVLLAKFMQRLHRSIASNDVLIRYGVPARLKPETAFTRDMLHTPEHQITITAPVRSNPATESVRACYARLLAALTTRFRPDREFNIAPDIRATIRSGTMESLGRVPVLHLASDYTSDKCQVYPSVRSGVVVAVNNTKHVVTPASCAVPAALLREIIHMYRANVHHSATASTDDVLAADIADIEAVIAEFATAAAEPQAAPADGKYVHAIDGKVRGLLQLMTKWTAAEKNPEGKEDMRGILRALKKLCWDRLSEDSQKKLLELK